MRIRSKPESEQESSRSEFKSIVSEFGIGPSMTGEGLTRFQKRTAGHLSFSLTMACPLRCKHCMVTTLSSRHAAEATLPLDTARAIAVDMPLLQHLGIWRISFTGGEPILAADSLRLLSGAADAVGIETTVVTACHWARTEIEAARTVGRFPGLHHWHLSTDLHHAEFLDPAHVLNAAHAIAAAGRNAMVRMAISRNPDGEESALIDFVSAGLPHGVPIVFQPISPVGRAKEIGVVPEMNEDGAPPTAPCLTTGPLIRHDGKLMPCCSALAMENGVSPFISVDVRELGIAAAVRAWREDPLMLLVRALGFTFPAAWVDEALDDRPIKPCPSHPCDYCVALWSNSEAREVVMEKLSCPMVLEKIKRVSESVFGATVHAEEAVL